MSKLPKNITILKQTKNIFIFLRDYDVIHFRFLDNEMKYIGKYKYSKNIIDIKEINDKSGHILFTNTLFEYDIKITKTFPIFYYFLNNNNNMSDYHIFDFKTINN